MVLIFALSSENAAESSETSGNLIDRVTSVIYPKFKELSEVEQEKIVSSLQNTVRKSAHFSVYCLMGILSFLTFISYENIKFPIRVGISALICFVYALSDEIHQIFIPGRSGEVRDVSIDFSGAVLGIIIMLLFSKIIKPLKHFRGKTA